MSYRAQVCCAVIASVFVVVAFFMAIITCFQLAAERRLF